MTSSRDSLDARATDVTFDEVSLCVELADGRKIIVPLEWFPRLRDATPEQRSVWELLGEGKGIHWSEIDEDLSVDGILRGTRAPGRPKQAS